jgi:hypothetical protein
MDKALKVVVEMQEWNWKRFKNDLKDMTADEADWRSLPQANSINLIMRHLRIEAAWHLGSLDAKGPRTQPLPASLPLDFEENLKELDELYKAFIQVLRDTTLSELEKRSASAYQEAATGRIPPAHFLAYHQAIHLAMHWGQIRTIRNLYRKTRGEPARFFPDNPTFPT